MSSSYSSDDSPPPNPQLHAKKQPPRPSKPARHPPARKPSKKHEVQVVRILKRGEDDDSYTDTGDSKDEQDTTTKKKGQRQAPGDVHTKKHKKKATGHTTAKASMLTAASRASSEPAKDDKKKRRGKRQEPAVRSQSERTVVPSPKDAELLPKALSIAFLNPPSRPSTPAHHHHHQPVKVYGLEPAVKPSSSPVTIRARVAPAPVHGSPRKASPNGGEYAGPTFSNSPAPSALPKPAFAMQPRTSPPAHSMDYKSPSKKNGLADAAFWMEGGLVSGGNTTANVTPSESPGSRSGGVTPTMFTTMGIAPIPTPHRHQHYTDELHVGNPGAPSRAEWKEQHDDGGGGSVLLGLLRGRSGEQQNDLDVWSQGLKSLLKMS